MCHVLQHSLRRGNTNDETAPHVAAKNASVPRGVAEVWEVWAEFGEGGLMILGGTLDNLITHICSTLYVHRSRYPFTTIRGSYHRIMGPTLTRSVYLQQLDRSLG